MSASPAALNPSQNESPLNAFRGAIQRKNPGPLYSAGLAVVAVAMVLLPLIYMTLVAFTVWVVVLHLKNDTWILDRGSGGGSFLKVVFYAGPAIAGGILVFFMVKPFFAAKTKVPEPITLDPAKEPLLFAFVRQIVGLVGAPMPSRIDVDCQVNASASLRRGWWSRDLVLTIGLPLASGLNMRQFAGVLAHEFGHFAQGAGMRLTYIVRKINFWFARVVYERDEWDLKLDQAAGGGDWRIRIILQLARGCVWITRRVLWALMHAGNAISCFMLRQMEYDADSYEAKVAGSDAFEQTAVRLRLLNVAAESAYQDVQQSWQSQRLPEDLPLLIGHKAGALPAEVQQKLASSASEKTGWFDTHPCDADRVVAARRLNEGGVFHVTQPATGLFTNFAALSRAVTRHQYEKHLELEFSEQNLMSADEILHESSASAEAAAMVRKYYGGVNLSLFPLLRPEQWPPSGSGDDVMAKWREAQLTTERLREDAARLSDQWAEHEKRIIDLTAAQRLIAAGFKLDPEEFGLAPHLITTGEQEAAAREGLQQASAAITELAGKLEPFAVALSARVVLALRRTQANADSGATKAAGELSDLGRLLVVLGAEMPNARRMGTRLKAFALLAQNRGNHSNPERVDQVVAELAAELKSLVNTAQDHLAPYRYPFRHARGQLTVAEYARYDKAEDHPWLKPFRDADAHVDRLFALNYQLIGRILVFAEIGEKSMEMPRV